LVVAASLREACGPPIRLSQGYNVTGRAAATGRLPPAPKSNVVLNTQPTVTCASRSHGWACVSLDDMRAVAAPPTAPPPIASPPMAAPPIARTIPQMPSSIADSHGNGRKPGPPQQKARQDRYDSWAYPP